MTQKEINLVCGKNIESIAQGSDYTIYRTKQDSGEGFVKEYQLWDGVFLGILDLNLEHIDYSEISMERACDFISLNHCHTGLFEAEFQNGQWIHLNEGDSSINLPEHTPVSHRFPLGRYKGAILILDLKKLKTSFQTVLGEETPIHFQRIKEKISKHNSFLVWNNQQDQHSLNEIWKEFYKENVSLFYLKLKCLELFNLLNADEPMITKPCRYYEKQQLYKVNQIHELLVANLSIRYTLPQLSEMFSISQTSLKECFKNTYGMPISAYMLRYRMSYAEKLLSETELSVADISHQLGYENHSKFTLAFKKATTMTPMEYRNKKNNYKGLI